jgi:hypothetical protein
MYTGALLRLKNVEGIWIMNKNTKLRITDFRIGFFVGILSKKRSNE